MFRNGFDFKVNDSILDQNFCFTSIYEQLVCKCLYGNNTEILFTVRSLMIPIEVIRSLKSKDRRLPKEKGQTTIYKTLHRKRKIVHHKPH